MNIDITPYLTPASSQLLIRTTRLNDYRLLSVGAVDQLLQVQIRLIALISNHKTGLVPTFDELNIIKEGIREVLMSCELAGEGVRKHAMPENEAEGIKKLLRTFSTIVNS